MMYRLVFACIALLIVGRPGVHGTGAQQSGRSGTDIGPLHDHHVHMLSSELVRDWRSLGVPFSRPDSFYSSASTVLEQGNVGRAIILSMAYLYGSRGFQRLGASVEAEHESVRRENNFIASVVRASRGRFAGFGSVNPLRPYAIEELRRCIDELQMSGIKLHFLNSRIDLTDNSHLEQVRQVFALAREKRVPMLLHLSSLEGETGTKGAEVLLGELIARHPGVDVYVAHLGGWGGYSAETEAVLNIFIRHLGQDSGLRDRRVLFDLSAVLLTERSEGVQPPDEERLKRLASDLRRLGLQRVLFGSDHPVFNSKDYARTLLQKLPLREEEIQQILSNEAPVLKLLR